MPDTITLKMLRERAGKSQQQVVDELETQEGFRVINRQMLSHLETGRNTQSAAFGALCRYYGVEPAALLPPGAIYMDQRRVGGASEPVEGLATLAA